VETRVWDSARRKYDASGMYARLASFPLDLMNAERAAKSWAGALHLPLAPVRILVAGMGGSAIAGDLAARAADAFPGAPIHVVRDYAPPGWLDAKTLVVASSYSGNTEETLSVHAEATRRGATVVCLTTGGELLRRASRSRQPYLRLPEGMPPRTALPHLLVPLLRVLERVGRTRGVGSDLEDAFRTAGRVLTVCRLDRSETGNPAKRIARRFATGHPTVYATAAVSPAGYRWQTQINENAKSLCAFATLPELDHNILTAYDAVDGNAARSEIVVLTEADPAPPVARRVRANLALWRRTAASCVAYPAVGRSALAQLLSHVVLGDWVSYYLALLRRVDPTPVAMIERLKRGLAHNR